MSELITDKLTGKTTAGDITVTSEGGAATQSLQQGLIKSWINFNGQNTVAVRQSFNATSLTDNGEGRYQYAYVSLMSYSNYAPTTDAQWDENQDANGCWSCIDKAGSAVTTAQLRIKAMIEYNNSVDVRMATAQVSGSLA
jgi:hypothetical protein